MFRIRTKPDKAIPENEKDNRGISSLFYSKYKTENCCISDISFQLGFSSLNYFGKSFKEYFGMSPTAYRKFHQEQKDNHSI